ncbi:MAG: hypothetical protein ACRDST_01580 [Pseudonocardiaceae bacterium]
MDWAMLGITQQWITRMYDCNYGRPDATEQVIDRVHTGYHAATIEVIFAPAFAVSLAALA